MGTKEDKRRNGGNKEEGWKKMKIRRENEKRGKNEKIKKAKEDLGEV